MNYYAWLVNRLSSANMPYYRWRGFNSNNEEITMVSQATSRGQLRRQLLEMRIFPTQISYCWERSILGRRTPKTSEVNYFIEQLALLLKAQFPLARALKIIAQGENSQPVQNLAVKCREAVLQGHSLGETWRSQPNCFSEIVCNLVEVGEHSGALEVVLEELVLHLHKLAEQRARIIQAMLYPSVVLGVSVMVSGLFLIWVIPQLKLMFESFGAPLPVYTQIIIALSQWLQTTWWLVLSLSGLVVWGLRLTYQRIPSFRIWLDKMVLHVPMLRRVLQDSMIVRLSYTLSLTLRAGIPILRAMEISLTTISNCYYRQILQKLLGLLSQGQSLHAALHSLQLFPMEVVQLIALGEETGRLDYALNQITTVYLVRLDRLISRLQQVLEPLFLLILGGMVGGLVVGMYLPIFQLGNVV